MPNFDINSHFINEANFSQVKFGEDGYILEVELNELQQIQREKLKKTVKESIGDYGVLCKGTYKFDGESLRIMNEEVIVDGEFLTLNDITIDGLKENTKVYIQTFDKEVTYSDTLKKYGNDNGITTVTNKIKDARIGVETSRRYVLSYVLSTTSNPQRNNLLLGEVIKGKFISYSKCLNKSSVTHESKNGSQVEFMSLSGKLFNKPHLINRREQSNYLNNRVVQDGLKQVVYERIVNSPKKIDNAVTKSADNISFLFSNLNASFVADEPIILSNTDGRIRLVVLGDGSLTLSYYTTKFNYLSLNINVTKSKYNDVYINLKGNKVTMYVNGRYYYYEMSTSTSSLTSSTTFYLLGSWNGAKMVDSSLDGFCSYDRELTETEIKHNLAVLNKNNFTKLDNKVVGKIQGFSSKSLLSSSDKNVNTSSDETVIYVNNTVEEDAYGHVFKNLTDKDVVISVGNLDTKTFKRNQTVLANSTYKFTTKNEYVRNYQGVKSNGWEINEESKNTLLYGCVLVLDGSQDYVESSIPYGLSPTKAIISANGIDYQVYEPYIKGETYVMRAPKGTQNWTKINESEKRDTEKYDYKLTYSASSLCSTLSAYDYIDRVRKVKVICTKEAVLNGSESWTKYNVENADFLAFNTTLSDAKINSQPVASSCRNKTYCWDRREHLLCAIHPTAKTFWITIDKTKLSSQDVTGLKSWLQTNPITLRYALETPVETPLTDDELKAYDAHRQVMELHGLTNVCDTLEVMEDGTGVKTQYFDKQYLSILLDKAFLQANAPNQEETLFFQGQQFANFKPHSNYTQLMCGSFKGVDAGKLWSTDEEGICLNNSSFFQIRVSKSRLTSLDLDGFNEYLRYNDFLVYAELKTPITTLIPKELMPSIVHDNSSPNLEYGINTLKVNSPVRASYLSFVHYPSISNLLNEITMNELTSLCHSLESKKYYTYAEVELTRANVGYQSGKLINIPFSLSEGVYVNTKTVKLLTNINITTVNSTATGAQFTASSAKATLTSEDGHNFILTIENSSDNVGIVFLSSNALISIGSRGDN